MRGETCRALCLSSEAPDCAALALLLLAPHTRLHAPQQMRHANQSHATAHYQNRKSGTFLSPHLRHAVAALSSTRGAVASLPRARKKKTHNKGEVRSEAHGRARCYLLGRERLCVWNASSALRSLSSIRNESFKPASSNGSLSSSLIAQLPQPSLASRCFLKTLEHLHCFGAENVHQQLLNVGLRSCCLEIWVLQQNSCLRTLVCKNKQKGVGKKTTKYRIASVEETLTGIKGHHLSEKIFGSGIPRVGIIVWRNNASADQEHGTRPLGSGRILVARLLCLVLQRPM